MNHKSLKNMESAVIITRNVDGLVKIQKGQTSIILLDRKQNHLDSINTINTSYISYRNQKSLKKSFSEEDLNLYESCVAADNKEVQKQSNQESQKILSEKSKENAEIQATLQDMLLSQKGLFQSRVSRRELNISKNGSETGLRQMEKSIKLPVDLEETLQNLMQHLESGNDNFESFDNSEIIARDFLEVPEQQSELKVEEKVENNKIESSQQSAQIEEKVVENSISERVKNTEHVVETKKKSVFGIKKMFFLLSMMLNLACLFLLMRQKMEPARVKEVIIEKQVLVPHKQERQLNHVITAADVYTSEEYRLLFNEKEQLYKDNNYYRKHIEVLEAEKNMLEEQKIENHRVIAGLTEDKHKFQERFKELEMNLNRTIEIISQLKKHLPGSLGDTITTNFKQLVNIVGKML